MVFVGRSIDKKAEIAKNLGFLNYPSGLVIPQKEANGLTKDKLMFIVSGSYGQPGSAMYRIALGEHDYLSAESADVVIFSSDPAPPGSKANVDALVDRLIEKDVDVHYYDMQEDLHVSGHGSQKDIEMLFALTKPKYFIPIGGTVRHMHAFSIIAQNMGAAKANVFELGAGQIVEFSDKNARLGGKIHVKNVLVDGLGIGDVGNVVLRDRQVLAKEGIAIVMIQLDKGEGKIVDIPEVISRGFIFNKEGKEFLNRAGRFLLEKLNTRKYVDSRVAREVTVDVLERYFFKETGRRPMVMPVVVEV